MTGVGGVGPGRGGRMSWQRKRDAVLPLLRAENLETVSRSLGAAAALAVGALAACTPGQIQPPQGQLVEEVVRLP